MTTEHHGDKKFQCIPLLRDRHIKPFLPYYAPYFTKAATKTFPNKNLKTQEMGTS